MKKYLALFAVLGLLVACQGKDNPSNGQEENKDFQFGAVDLGLSVKWANANLGAVAPEGYGDYYAWGETDTKANYSWETYKWCEGSNTTLTKYNSIDNKYILDASDDVVHVKLGGKWRMPTVSEVEELLTTRNNANYKWERKSINGHEGWLLTYTVNQNSIFFPAAGYRIGYDPKYVGTLGIYWTSSLESDPVTAAYTLYSNASEVKRGNNSRYIGQPVRPVSE